jgi:peptidoglycan/xylan/chitin deacetylase (PgdA/CDA1 family)
VSVQWIFDKLSPAGPAARLNVFIFHRVLPSPDPLFPSEPDTVRFEIQVRWIMRWFNVLPLPDAILRLRSQGLPARAAAITFDDGYADNCTLAMPILRQAGLSATFFIATGYLDGGRMWNDSVIEVVRNANGPKLDLSDFSLGDYAIGTVAERQKCLSQLLGALKYMEPARREKLASDMAVAAKVQAPHDLMLTSDQVRSMANAGMTIGAHTVSHPILARVAEPVARTEMIQSKRQLEAITGREVDLFAYPNGRPQSDYDMTHVRLARDVGFSAAVSTSWGTATKDSDMFQIPRFTPWDRTKLRYALRLAHNMRQAATTVN